MPRAKETKRPDVCTRYALEHIPSGLYFCGGANPDTLDVATLYSSRSVAMDNAIWKMVPVRCRVLTSKKKNVKRTR